VTVSPHTARSRRAIDEPYRPIAAALQLPTEHVTTIDQSHERCATLGLSRFEQPDLSPLGRADLTISRERNLRLHAHAAPVMEMLFEQIVQTQSMVVLCDATGTIIHSIGDDDFLSRASKVALAPGVNWSEQAKGTNAIGTALVAETPTLVHADEHFMHANHFLTCSAAPILDPRGNILGVLDVTGDQRSYHQHTMALVRMSARMIENHWLSDDYRHVMRLHFHNRAEFIGTLMEGILAVTPDGKIVGANRSALDQLAMSGAAVRMHSLPSLLGTTVGALVEHFRSPLATPLIARTADNRQVHVMARFNFPAWHSTAGSETSSEATPSAGSPLPQRVAAAPRGNMAEPIGLAALTTGDTQMAAIAAKVRRVIDRDIPILILGETGTGKELLARAIHQESQRSRQPFIAVNCASIPDTLIESELFGYEEGAFTGARRKGAVGKILQANGGTLFLDEIGDMPIALQAHLLRVLQERQVVPLGSNKAMAVDVAIVCATHRNLREMIAAQTFREDLYYRLNGLAVRLPALRERSDLAALAERIVERETQRSLALSPEVAALLARCPWPGNVRQLFNVLRTACVMAAGERTIRREHLPDDFLDEVSGLEVRVAVMPPHQFSATAAVPAAEATPMPADNPASRSLDDIEIDAIRHALDAAGGNISEAAKRLGISRNTIYRKLRWNSPVSST
jgi:sigma-54 dependent transcriptional regulator, acetoin dehydrogenase operon transcriptional activator AcoR